MFDIAILIRILVFAVVIVAMGFGSYVICYAKEWLEEKI